MSQDQNNKKVMRQFLSLPVVLGTLLIATGSIGVYVSRQASHQVVRLNDTALGPTLAFQEINDQLYQLSQNLLRVDQSSATAESQAKVLKKSKSLLKHIGKLVKEQDQNSQGQAYQAYLHKWIADWEAFQADVAPKLESLEQLKPVLAKEDETIGSLVEKMNNVSEFIQADVKDQLEQSTVFSKRATVALIVVLALGTLIGAFSSIIIVGSIRKLFLVIAEGKKNIETLLNNLDQGFLSFDAKANIQEGVSRAAKDFFGGDPTGKTFHDICPVDEKAREAIRGWEELLFGGTLGFADFQPLAPKSFEREGRYIELDFRPIYNEVSGKQALAKVICIASDKTEERRLRAKAEAEAALVQLVMTALSDRPSFVDFVIETRKMIDAVSHELETPSPHVEALFRGMHSIKGSCGAFHMMGVAKVAHELESRLAELKVEGPEKVAAFLPTLREGITRIRAEFDGFLQEHETFLGKVGDEGDRTKTVSVSAIYDLCGLLYAQSGGESPVFKRFVDHFVQEDVAVPFRKYEGMIAGIAERQLKKVRCVIESGRAKVFLDPYLPLAGAFVHGFRNAVDHGIEDEMTRVELGKREFGTLHLKFDRTRTVQGEVLQITLEDDGGGIDPKVIRVKAVEKGVISADAVAKLSDFEAIQLLFTNGFSTRDEVTDISGRGVGLDAVRFEAEKLGGRAWLDSEKGKGTRLCVEVPWINSPIFLVDKRPHKEVRAA